MCWKHTKKVKMTKAERLKKQQEEAEAARLQAEKEEQERLERERKLEEIQKLEEKAEQNRDLELTELRHLLEDNYSAITKWKVGAAEKAEWERYMLCDGVPDAKDQRAVNTFVTLWKDYSDSDIGEELELCNAAVKLIAALDELVKEGKDPELVPKYCDALMEVQEILHAKHLFIAEKLLKGASDNIDPDTRNMQTVSKHKNVTLCLWANLFKNPSFTGFDFKEAGLSFKLPGELAVSDIAVRILHAHYDHLSILSRLRHPPAKPIVEEIPPPFQEPEETQAVDCTSELPIPSPPPSPISEPSRKSTSPPSSEESMTPTQTEVLSGQSSSLVSCVTPIKDPSWPSLAQLNYLSSAVPELEEPENDPEVVNLVQYTTLGGVFYYDLLQLPPQPIRRKGYTILQMVDGLKVFPYPIKRPNNEESSDDPSETPQIKACSPVGVSIVLPEWVIFMEMPLVARWNAEDASWRKDGITNVSYEEEEGKISFEMESFQIFALMHNTFANFPFRGWELRPLGQNSAMFTVKGALIEISITIKGSQCMLQLAQKRGLPDLVGKWMTAPALQKAMLKAGLNIFVNENTHKYVSVCTKNPLIEQFAYDQMALSASACAFSWSKWNATCGEENLVLLGCEHLKVNLVPEDSWNTYFMGSQRSRQLEITEKSEAFSTDHAAGSEFHSTLIHVLQDSMSPDGIDLVRKSHHCFIDTVQTLLSSTRPLVFS
ncbi:dynein axonemal intermediate chain 7 isoform X2 [Poeciliopsis prolifica]|uniref:dynein axonemal intermediate chain 7 isoform X2 n=1 Tax=Poeciliopsis prolifica TaxID=188132 RepID=UPI0024139F6D|nr:dynein axonemal intermediate chain 7 isoform X2 [Poeciliopsis prolifica]